MRLALIAVLLWGLLAACVSREAASPPVRSSTAPTTTTRSEPTKRVKDSAVVKAGLATVNTVLADCAPGRPRGPGCDWSILEANILALTRRIAAAIEDLDPQAFAYVTLTAAIDEVDSAVFVFGLSRCVEWFEVGTSGDRVQDAFCPTNEWATLVVAWRDLESAVRTA